ncbi:hypothetical protein E4K10_48335 [Streptomyces sp. T1317-0309]|nr:hypothetical protein E4K10_48335 [Streptomyces sp. T1317-0309]
MTGGIGRPVEAANLFIDATSVAAAQADTNNIDIGIAAGAVTKGPINPQDRKSRWFDPTSSPNRHSPSYSKTYASSRSRTPPAS